MEMFCSLEVEDGDGEDGAEMAEARAARFVYAGREEAQIGL